MHGRQEQQQHARPPPALLPDTAGGSLKSPLLSHEGSEHGLKKADFMCSWGEVCIGGPASDLHRPRLVVVLVVLGLLRWQPCASSSLWRRACSTRCVFTRQRTHACSTRHACGKQAQAARKPADAPAGTAISGGPLCGSCSRQCCRP